ELRGPGAQADPPAFEDVRDRVRLLLAHARFEYSQHKSPTTLIRCHSGHPEVIRGISGWAGVRDPSGYLGMTITQPGFHILHRSTEMISGSPYFAYRSARIATHSAAVFVKSHTFSGLPSRI